LWGARPADWALSEDRQTPTYEAALTRVGLEPGQLVLDVGCGVGAFLRLVIERGARPFGLDASAALIAFARERLPGADLRVGDMQALPYEDDTFDLVTAFNSLFFANDIVAAVREAGRVAKPTAPVVIQVWGPREHNDLETMKEIVRPFLPPRPADAPPEPDYSKVGVLEGIATKAGLTPEQTFDSTWSYGFPDEATLRRALVAPAGIATLVGPAHEQVVKDAIVAGLAPHRTADGGYRLANQFHYLVARVKLDSLRSRGNVPRLAGTTDPRGRSRVPARTRRSGSSTRGPGETLERLRAGARRNGALERRTRLAPAALA
jgi:SAM-dependent methyltransferase